MRINEHGMLLDIPDVGDNRNNPVASHIKYILNEIFVDGAYDYADVSGNYVADVGAYCGETAVYFSKQGAKKVFAFEPFSSFDCILHNAILNGCDNIEPIRAAISPHKSQILLNPEFVNDGASRLRDGAGNTPIQTLGIKDVVGIIDKDADNIHASCASSHYILKMDIEGAEFGAISASTQETLRRFESIMIECHNHSGDTLYLVRKLEKCGFDVMVLPHDNVTCMLYARREEW